VRLTPWEEERLLIFSAAELARRHRAAGLLLNGPEAIALMCDAMLEAARAGATYADVEAAGLAAVSPDAVLPGVRELVDDVRLEVLFGDGPRLIVLLDPLGAGRAPSVDGPGAVVPGTESGDEPGTELGGTDPDNAWMLPPAGLERREIEVENTSRRVVRISSHYPFDRVNPRLAFDRDRASGFHLDLPAGGSERWSPGESKLVRLVRYAGDTQHVEGHVTDDPGDKRRADGAAS
jgi:urease subunit gamma/beta